MKTNAHLKLICVLAAFLAAGFASVGQVSAAYELHWLTLDSGGVDCAGSGFTLHGTAGQPEAGPTATGGDFTLAGGFWTGLAEIGPTLKIVRSGSNVIISWPASAAGFHLEHCNALPRTPDGNQWSSNSSVAFVYGDEKVVVESAANARFYRLIKP